MDSKTMLAAVAGFLIGLAAILVIPAIGGEARTAGAMATTSGAEAGALVVDFLAANGVNATLLAVSDESGVYKAVVKDSAGIASELYVTKDGRLLFQPAVVGISEATALLAARRGFFDCLAAKGLKFYGSTETNATLLQLQILGGSQFVDRIYVSCEGAHAQACLDANVTDVPTFLYGNQSYAGVRTLDWLINLTGCRIAQ